MKSNEIVVKTPGKRLAPAITAEIQRAIAAKLPKALETYTLKRIAATANTAVEKSLPPGDSISAAKKRKIEVEVEVRLNPPTIIITIRF